jgi:hypothetical protein
MKTMVEGITLNTEQPFKDKFYEIVRPLKNIQHSTPSCFVVYGKADNTMEKNSTTTPVKRLDSIISDETGIKYLRSIERQYKQVFTYTLNFLIHDPSPDVLSNIAKKGIIDQCLSYIYANKKPTYNVPIPSDMVTYQEFQEMELNCEVDVGQSGFSTDLVDDGIYIFYLDVIFKDGVYLLKEEGTLSESTLEIVSPVEVSRV